MTQEQWVAGRYRCLYKLGRGGFSEVFLAEDVRLGNRKVALKRVAAHLIHDDERILKFQQEAQIIGHLTNPFTVRAFDFGEDEGGRFYIAMEYVQGETLHEILKREKRLSVERSVKAGIQILDALAEAHQLGIIHRDLKPKNVMLVPQRHGDLIKVLDFGVARILRGDLEPGEDEWTLVGTATYMAPEQAQGFPVSSASDIYSVGVILYHMLTGRPPFTSKEDPVAVMIHHALSEAPSIRETHPELEIPEKLDRLILKALEKKPEDRFQSAHVFCNELEAFWEDWSQEYSRSLTVEAETYNGRVSTERPRPQDKSLRQAESTDGISLNASGTKSDHTLDQHARKMNLEQLGEEEPPTQATNHIALTRETGTIAVSWENSHSNRMLDLARNQAHSTLKESHDSSPQEHSSTNDLSTNDLSTNDLSTNDLSTNDLSTNDLSTTDLSTSQSAEPISAVQEEHSGSMAEKPQKPGSAAKASGVEEATPPQSTRDGSSKPVLPKPMAPPSLFKTIQSPTELEGLTAPTTSTPSEAPETQPAQEHKAETSGLAPSEKEAKPEAPLPPQEPSDTLQVRTEDILGSLPSSDLEVEAESASERLLWLGQSSETKGEATFPEQPAIPERPPSASKEIQEVHNEIAASSAQEESPISGDWDVPTQQQLISDFDLSSLEVLSPHRSETTSTKRKERQPNSPEPAPTPHLTNESPTTSNEGLEADFSLNTHPDTAPAVEPAQAPAWPFSGMTIPPPAPAHGFPPISAPPQNVHWSVPPSPRNGNLFGNASPPSQVEHISVLDNDPFQQMTPEERANALFFGLDEYGLTAEFKSSLRRRWVGLFAGFVFAGGLLWLLASFGGGNEAQQKIQEEEAFRLALKEGDQEITASRYRKAYLSYRRALMLRPKSKEAKRRMRLAKLDLEASAQLRRARKWMRRRRYWRAYRIVQNIDSTTSTAQESKRVMNRLRPYLIASLAQQARILIRQRKWVKAANLCQRLERQDPDHDLLGRPCRYARRKAKRYR